MTNAISTQHYIVFEDTRTLVPHFSLKPVQPLAPNVETGGIAVLLTACKCLLESRQSSRKIPLYLRPGIQGFCALLVLHPLACQRMTLTCG